MRSAISFLLSHTASAATIGEWLVAYACLPKGLHMLREKTYPPAQFDSGPTARPPKRRGVMLYLLVALGAVRVFLYVLQ